jgi:hypothetical protein
VAFSGGGGGYHHQLPVIVNSQHLGEQSLAGSSSFPPIISSSGPTSIQVKKSPNVEMAAKGESVSSSVTSNSGLIDDFSTQLPPIRPPTILPPSTTLSSRPHEFAVTAETSISAAVQVSATTSSSSITIFDSINPKRPAKSRSADRSELTFKKFLENNEPEFDGCTEQVRVWVNDRNVHYFDCTCDRRKPTHDLKKIKKHILQLHHSGKKPKLMLATPVD